MEIGKYCNISPQTESFTYDFDGDLLGTVKPGFKWSFRHTLRCGFMGWLQAHEAARS